MTGGPTPLLGDTDRCLRFGSAALAPLSEIFSTLRADFGFWLETTGFVELVEDEDDFEMLISLAGRSAALEDWGCAIERSRRCRCWRYLNCHERVVMPTHLDVRNLTIFQLFGRR